MAFCAHDSGTPLAVVVGSVRLDGRAQQAVRRRLSTEELPLNGDGSARAAYPIRASHCRSRSLQETFEGDCRCRLRVTGRFILEVR